MDVRSLPTDNLYKFMALAGLVGTLYFPGLYLIELRLYGEKLIAADTESQLVNSDWEALGKVVDRQGKRQRELRHEANELTKAAKALLARVHAPRGAALSGKRFEELRSRLEEQKAAQREIEREQAEHEGRSEELHKTSIRMQGKAEELKILRLDLDASAAQTRLWTNLSMAFMFAGFVLWFWRVQRYQDQVLRRQANDVPPVRRSA